MTRRAFTAAAAAAGAGLLADQETGVLEGRVTGENGAPVAGAALKAEHTVRRLTNSALTGSDGRYVFPALPGGIHSLYVTRQGYCSVWIRQVVVRSGERTKKDVTLDAEAACDPRKVASRLLSSDL